MSYRLQYFTTVATYKFETLATLDGQCYSCFLFPLKNMDLESDVLSSHKVKTSGFVSILEMYKVGFRLYSVFVVIVLIYGYGWIASAKVAIPSILTARGSFRAKPCQSGLLYSFGDIGNMYWLDFFKKISNKRENLPCPEISQASGVCLNAPLNSSKSTF